MLSFHVKPGMMVWETFSETILLKNIIITDGFTLYSVSVQEKLSELK